MLEKDPILQEMQINDYKYKNIVYLDDEVYRDSQLKVVRQLSKLANKELQKDKADRRPIKLVISSYGGNVYDAYAIISKMEEIQEKGIEIHTHCNGYAASAGSLILIAGTKGHRTSSRYAWILFHQPQLYSDGHETMQERLSSVRELEVLWRTLTTIIKKHSEIPESEIEDYTEKNIDFSYTPEECIDRKIIDKIL